MRCIIHFASTGASGNLLLKREWTFRFQKTWEFVTNQLLGFQGKHQSMESACYTIQVRGVKACDEKPMTAVGLTRGDAERTGIEHGRQASMRQEIIPANSRFRQNASSL